jgi:hypothetical protein
MPLTPVTQEEPAMWQVNKHQENILWPIRPAMESPHPAPEHSVFITHHESRFTLPLLNFLETR